MGSTCFLNFVCCFVCFVFLILKLSVNDRYKKLHFLLDSTYRQTKFRLLSSFQLSGLLQQKSTKH